jgi:hypothetical protein
MAVGKKSGVSYTSNEPNLNDFLSKVGKVLRLFL